MYLNTNPYLTTTIAADRRRSYAIEAEISRTRRTGRLARRAARRGAPPVAQVSAQDLTAQEVAAHEVAAHEVAANVRPLTLQPASFEAPVNGTKVLASSDHEHASARVA